jgi:hypothetical protein
MTCPAPVANIAGRCSSCGTWTEGIHLPDDGPTGLYCDTCCPVCSLINKPLIPKEKSCEQTK